MEFAKENIVPETDTFNEMKEFWINKLSGFCPNINFVSCIKSKGVTRAENQITAIGFNEDLSLKLLKLSKNSDLSLYIVLTACLKILVYRYTGSKDISVVSPMYKENCDKQTGDNLILLRDRLEGIDTFRDLLLRVRETTLDAYQNQNYPLCELTEVLDSLKAGDIFELSNTICLLKNIHEEKTIRITKENIAFIFERQDRSVSGHIEYDPANFESGFIKQIAEHFCKILESVLRNINICLKDISMLSSEELQDLLVNLNNRYCQYPQDKTIIQLFEEQVLKTPCKNALEFGNTGITYQELNEKANKLAQLLREKGIKQNKIVGIILDHTPDLIIGILAILKAGGAYLPIDPIYSQSRVLSMLKESKAAVLLTKEELSKKYSFSFLQNVEDETIRPFKTIAREQIKNLDSVPIPDRSLVDYEKYHEFLGLSMVKYNIAIQATRGCPYNCAYCHKIWPKSHVVRSAENIFEEVKLFYNMGIKRFVFVDDIFNLDVENSSKFYKLLIKNGIKIHMFFPNGVRGDILTKEYIDLMVEAGVINIGMALETASPRIQKLIKKNLNLERLRENIEYIAEKYPHVLLDVFLMHGFPTETEEEAMMTLDFIKSIKWIHFANLNILKIFPGSEMENLALDCGVPKEVIERSANKAYHELPDTLPFPKSFTRKYQSQFMNEYFILKERLLKVLPAQMKVLTEDELVQKYNSYLPVDIRAFKDLLDFAGISRDELGDAEFLKEDEVAVPNFNEKVRKCFPQIKPDDNALRILFIDVSQLFTSDAVNELYYVKEPPLGYMYLMAYLKNVYGSKVHGKIAKSGMDFESFDELKNLIRQFKPDVIGVRSLTFYRDFFHKTISKIREWGIDTPIIAGGPYATSSYKSLLKDKDIDLAVLGEGEETLGELIGKILENQGKLPKEDVLKSIKGIAFIENKENLSKNLLSRDIIFMDDIFKSTKDKEGEKLDNPNNPDDLAYVIYTSGTTGNPKGAMITQRGLMNYIWWASKVYFNNDELSIPLYSSISFDLTVTSIFTPLISGNKIIIYNEKDKALAIRKIIEDNKVEIIKLTPTHLKLIEDMDFSTSRLKKLIVGGEDLKSDLADKIHKAFKGGVDIFNEYGPTETVVGCMIHKYNPQEDINHSVPIGIPSDNVQLYLLDEFLNPVPKGCTGELYISGDGVAKGYISRDDLTAEKFIDNPFIPEQKMYKTGDLARILPNGIMEFAGRADEQVKIRGYRIEPGEIETKLQKHGEINEAVVIIKQDQSGNKFLCAYIVTKNDFTAAELREYLKDELPEYAVPSHFFKIERMPLTSNGKIDKSKLLEFEDSIDSGTEYKAPENAVEKKLAEIWQKVLNVTQVGINNNFFDLGGNSMLLIQMHSELEKQCDVSISIPDLFSYPTIDKLAQYITNHESPSNVSQEIEKTDEEDMEDIMSLFEQVENGNVSLDDAVESINKNHNKD